MLIWLGKIPFQGIYLANEYCGSSVQPVLRCFPELFDHGTLSFMMQLFLVEHITILVYYVYTCVLLKWRSRLWSMKEKSSNLGSISY